MPSEETQIPEGITFGEKVAIFPRLPDFVLENDYLSTQLVEIEPAIEKFQYVRRNQTIGWVKLHRPPPPHSLRQRLIGTKEVACPIRSPVDGLLLCRVAEFSLTGQRDAPAFLLPDDEPESESLHAAIPELSMMVSDHASRLFDAGSPQLADMKATMTVFDTRCAIVDALPRFAKHLDVARIEKPHLRPYLKHLPSPDGTWT